MLYLNSNECCPDGDCPQTRCGDCVKCNPLVCVVLVSDAASDYVENLDHYDTYLATNPDGTQAYSYDGECLHIAVPRGAAPPSDTNINIVSNFQVLPTSAFTEGDFDYCNPDYCYEYPNDPDCYCTPEDAYKWNGRESVNWVYYSYSSSGHASPMDGWPLPFMGVEWLCGYSEGGYSLYFERGVGWTFFDSLGDAYIQPSGFGNIFTYQGNDQATSPYYEII